MRYHQRKPDRGSRIEVFCGIPPKTIGFERWPVICTPVYLDVPDLNLKGVNTIDKSWKLRRHNSLDWIPGFN